VFANYQYPLALILTHRRGVGIMVCKDKSILDSQNFINSNLFHFIKDKKPLFSNEGIFEFIHLQDIIFSRAIGKTAENLFAIYQKSLHESSLSSHEVKTLIVGVGPGSFTGLRLGCAFVNGMKIASTGMNLLPVSTYLTPDLLSICRENSCEEECIKQLGDYHLEDESTGYITFFDLIVCLLKAKEEKRNFIDSLAPEYGREPGPVLKLREGTNV
jgi:tRNA N6-adenosine threonylcarbamoyltransferase